jgi:predicted transport protein
MQIYNIQNDKLIELEEKIFKLERDIQNIFENNLQTVMGLKLICSERTIKNRRIDTLAFDEQANAFVIIEYKRDRNSSVFDQGITYLQLMLQNKADFVLELSNLQKRFITKEDIDWTQSRVAFVSPSFSDIQIQATDFKDFAVELWEVKRFDKDTLSINQIKKSRTAESIKPLAQQDKELKRITDEIVVYDENYHFDNSSEEMVELYEKFRNAILNLSDGIEIKPQKFYIAFKKDTNIVDIALLKKTLKIWINAKLGDLEDAKNLARNVSDVGHRGNGDYEITVDSDADLEYIMSLVKQVLLK